MFQSQRYLQVHVKCNSAKWIIDGVSEFPLGGNGSAANVAWNRCSSLFVENRIDFRKLFNVDVCKGIERIKDDGIVVKVTSQIIYLQVLASIPFSKQIIVLR